MQLTDTLAAFDAHLDPASRAPVAVAFSGGGDSLALLVAALEWSRRRGRAVVALHVDHQLQPQSGAFADLAQATALKLGAGFRKLTWSGAKPTSGIPAAARTARLGLLADAVRELGGCVLLLGHTADDVAENEWMREEGGSLGRLRDWSPSPVWPAGRDLFHFRPLLGCRRAALRAELTARGLTWLDDPANEDGRFARTRARLALSAPFPLEGGRARDGGDSVSGYREVESSELNWSDDRLRMGFHPHPNPSPLQGEGLLADRWGGVWLDRTWLRDIADACRALALAATCASGREAPPRGERLGRLLSRLRTTEAFVATIGGARIVAGEGEVLFSRDEGRLNRSEGAELPVGSDQAWDGRFLLSASEPGWRIAALRGHAARLPKAEREALKRIPAALRPSLPVAVKDGETLTCPILAHGPVMALSLAERRMLAAMGAVQTESQAMALAHGEAGAGDLSPALKCLKAET